MDPRVIREQPDFDIGMRVATMGLINAMDSAERGSQSLRDVATIVGLDISPLPLSDFPADALEIFREVTTQQTTGRDLSVDKIKAVTAAVVAATAAHEERLIAQARRAAPTNLLSEPPLDASVTAGDGGEPSLLAWPTGFEGTPHASVTTGAGGKWGVSTEPFGGPAGGAATALTMAAPQHIRVAASPTATPRPLPEPLSGTVTEARLTEALKDFSRDFSSALLGQLQGLIQTTMQQSLRDMAATTASPTSVATSARYMAPPSNHSSDAGSSNGSSHSSGAASTQNEGDSNDDGDFSFEFNEPVTPHDKFPSDKGSNAFSIPPISSDNPAHRLDLVTNDMDVKQEAKLKELKSDASKELVAAVQDFIDTCANPGSTQGAKIQAAQKVDACATEGVLHPDCGGAEHSISAAFERGRMGPLPQLAGALGGGRGKAISMALGTDDVTELLAYMKGDFDGITPRKRATLEPSAAATTDLDGTNGHICQTFAYPSSVQAELEAKAKHDFLHGKFIGHINVTPNGKRVLTLQIDSIVVENLHRLEIVQDRITNALTAAVSRLLKVRDIDSLKRDKLQEIQRLLEQYARNEIDIGPPINVGYNAYLLLAVLSAQSRGLSIFHGAYLLQQISLFGWNRQRSNPNVLSGYFGGSNYFDLISQEQTVAEFYASIVHKRDAASAMSLPILLQNLDVAVAAGERHPVFTTKMGIYIFVLNMYLVLPIMFNQPNVRQYFGLSEYNKASLGELSASQVTDLIDRMASEGVGLPSGRLPADLQPPALFKRDKAAAKAQSIMQDQAFVATKSTKIFDGNSAYAQAVAEVRGLVPGKAQLQLISIVRTVRTLAKDYVHSDLDPFKGTIARGTTKKVFRADPLPLTLTRGTFAELDTSYVRGAKPVQDRLTALLQFIGDCMAWPGDSCGMPNQTEKRQLSEYGKVFAQQNPGSRWSVGEAYRQRDASVLRISGAGK
jgi:hypothetical protein